MSWCGLLCRKVDIEGLNTAKPSGDDHLISYDMRKRGAKLLQGNVRGSLVTCGLDIMYLAHKMPLSVVGLHIMFKEVKWFPNSCAVDTWYC